MHVVWKSMRFQIISHLLNSHLSPHDPAKTIYALLTSLAILRCWKAAGSRPRATRRPAGSRAPTWRLFNILVRWPAWRLLESIPRHRAIQLSMSTNWWKCCEHRGRRWRHQKKGERGKNEKSINDLFYVSIFECLVLLINNHNIPKISC